MIISKVLASDRDGIGCTEGGVSVPFGHEGRGERGCQWMVSDLTDEGCLPL